MREVSPRLQLMHLCLRDASAASSPSPELTGQRWQGFGKKPARSPSALLLGVSTEKKQKAHRHLEEGHDVVRYASPPHRSLLTRSHSWLRINSFIQNGYLTTSASQKLKNARSYFRFVAFNILYLPPYNPNSSSYAKHLVKTFKTAMKTVRGDKQSLNQKIASCLLSYQPIPPTYKNVCLLNYYCWEDICRRLGALRLDSSKSQLLFFFFFQIYSLSSRLTGAFA